MGWRGASQWLMFNWLIMISTPTFLQSLQQRQRHRRSNGLQMISFLVLMLFMIHLQGQYILILCYIFTVLACIYGLSQSIASVIVLNLNEATIILRGNWCCCYFYFVLLLLLLLKVICPRCLIK